MKTINYKGHFLAQGSEGYRLYEAKELEKLDAHIKDVDDKYLRLMGITFIKGFYISKSELVPVGKAMLGRFNSDKRVHFVHPEYYSEFVAEIKKSV